MAGFVKWLSAELDSGQIIWGRYFFHILLILVLAPTSAPRLLSSRRIDLQIVRSFLVLGATTSAFFALRYIFSLLKSILVRLFSYCMFMEMIRFTCFKKDSMTRLVLAPRWI